MRLVVVVLYAGFVMGCAAAKAVDVKDLEIAALKAQLAAASAKAAEHQASATAEERKNTSTRDEIVQTAHDLGSYNFIPPTFFTSSCTLHDPGITGSAKAVVYHRGEVSCADVQVLYDEVSVDLPEFLTTVMHYTLNPNPPPRHLVIRIMKLMELNDPLSFNPADNSCMQDPACKSGPYFGRTFADIGGTSNRINLYVLFSNDSRIKRPHLFADNLRRELAHVLLTAQRFVLWDREKDALVDRYMHWVDERKAASSAR